MHKIVSLCFTLILTYRLLANDSIVLIFNYWDIPTSFSSYDTTCNGPSNMLQIALPSGDNYQVTNTKVEYTMVATSPGYKSDQRSKLLFINTNTQETNEYLGVGNSPGAMMYSRMTSIANGIYPGGTVLKFGLLAKRIFQGTPGCNTLINKVAKNTWKITIYISEEIENPKVAINHDNPEAALDIAGKIKLGNDSSPPVQGNIRFNTITGDFEGFDGTQWLSFTKSHGAKNVSFGSTYANESNSTFYSDQMHNSMAVNDSFKVLRFEDELKIYKKDGNKYFYQQSFVNPNFGSAIDISGNVIAVSVESASANGQTYAGKVYLIKKINTLWQIIDSVQSPTPQVDAFFGSALSLFENYLIVGEPERTVGGDQERGMAHIFYNTGDDWVIQNSLTLGNGEEFDHFGQEVEINNNYAFISAPYKDINFQNQGAVYVFKKQGSEWLPHQTLTNTTPSDYLYFGLSLSLYGNDILVGVPGFDYYRGFVSLFTFNGLTWDHDIDFDNFTEADANDSWGDAVCLYKNNVFIASKSANGSGEVLHFIKENGTWILFEKYKPSTLIEFQHFGSKVAMIDGMIIIIAPYYHPPNSNTESKIYYFIQK